MTPAPGHFYVKGVWIMHEVILSVGIDIGTTTTQLVFSRLTIENLASSYTVPRISIVNKEIIYKSPIYFTPLTSPVEIDANAVKKIVEIEYAAAGIKPDQVQTGAVIITGETARKQNANLVLSALSKMAGDFVVATAGPDLESVLSARGAGSTSSRWSTGLLWPTLTLAAAPLTLLSLNAEVSEGPVAWISAAVWLKSRITRLITYFPELHVWLHAGVSIYASAVRLTCTSCASCAACWPTSWPWPCMSCLQMKPIR